MAQHRLDPEDDLPTLNAGRPLVAGVALLTVAMLLGAALGVLLAHLATGLVSALLWAVVLAVTAVMLAVGLVVYRDRRR